MPRFSSAHVRSNSRCTARVNESAEITTNRKLMTVTEVPSAGAENERRTASAPAPLRSKRSISESAIDPPSRAPRLAMTISSGMMALKAWAPTDSERSTISSSRTRSTIARPSATTSSPATRPITPPPPWPAGGRSSLDRLPARDQLVQDHDVERDHQDRPQREHGQRPELHEGVQDDEGDGEHPRRGVAGEQADPGQGHRHADDQRDPAPGGGVPDDHALAAADGDDVVVEDQRQAVERREAAVEEQDDAGERQPAVGARAGRQWRLARAVGGGGPRGGHDGSFRARRTGPHKGGRVPGDRASLAPGEGPCVTPCE